jgi:hypothetical protein
MGDHWNPIGEKQNFCKVWRPGTAAWKWNKIGQHLLPWLHCLGRRNFPSAGLKVNERVAANFMSTDTSNPCY